MVDICEVTDRMRAALRERLEGRSQTVRDLAVRFPPWKSFRLKSSGHYGVVTRWDDDGLVSICLRDEFNPGFLGRTVMGVRPNDLEECDLPGCVDVRELVGYVLSLEE